ncbi:MAG: TnpV protein [Clostridiaceae bacterium]|nr:TnpV protein [Clostridiaceae bacterium]
MNIEYTKYGDYYLPNLVAPQNMRGFKLGKYGKLRLNYLKENKRAEYMILLMNNKLQQHLMEIDKSANRRYEILIRQLTEKENITEELKTNNQMEWIGKMNYIKNCAEEIIFNELIYV